MAELKAQQALNQFPKILRWILVLSILAILPGYFIAKSISYNYWKKVYSQYLITAKPSFTEAKEPTVSNVFITTSGEDTFGAAVKIDNNNLELSLPTAGYSLSFYNGAGEQIYQDSGKTFLLPNDSKYLVVPRFTAKEEIKSAKFSWTSDLHWEKRENINKINIQTSAPDTYNQFIPAAFVAEGNYFNDSPYQLATVRLTFIIFNQGNQIVGVSRRDDFTVMPFERRTYKQIWPNIYGDPNYTVKIFAETNPLDSQNVTVPPAPTGPASDLSRPKTGRD